MKLPGLGILFALWTAAVSAQTTNYNFTFPANVAVPDGNVNGLALATNLTGMGSLMTRVTVSLDITGGFNGDLYAYLRGPNGGFAVLLNRTGVTAGNAFGYSDTGFNITFDDSANNNDIHFYQSSDYNLNGGGELTGDWSSDGRAIDPLSSPSLFDTTASSATLNSFTGTNPNGDWTLFLADMSAGGTSTLNDWTVNIITTVPEPPASALLVTGAVLLACWMRRRPCGQTSD